MMPLMQNHVACGAILLLSVASFWIINASASRSFPCTFRELGFFQRCLSFFDANAWKPSEPTPAQAPPSPPPSPSIPSTPREEESVAPVTACGTVDPNSLPPEVWEMCLKCLDLASLVNLETAVAKTLPANLSSTFSEAWNVQEARVDPGERVEGATARDRAIGSCLPYRRQLMRRFVEKLWTTGPAGNETVLSMQALVGGDYDVYVAFSRPARVGCRRTFLAGDFVESDDDDVAGDGLFAIFRFDLSSFDLINWPALQHLASSDGDAFIQHYNDERAVLEDDIEGALGETMVTLAAIHRTTLTPSVLFTSDKEDAMNGFSLYTNGDNVDPLFLAWPRCRRCRNEYCRAGSMDTSACDGVERMRYMHFIVYGIEDESPATLAVMLTVRQNFGRCWRPWWLTNNVLVFFMLCLVCVYNVNFWLNHDLHATSVEFFVERY